VRVALGHSGATDEARGRNCIGIDDGLVGVYPLGVSGVDPTASRFMQLFSATYSLLYRRSVPEGITLTPEGRGLLLHLAWSGPLTIGDLALHADRAQSVVSESVSVLESHALLARVRDPRDRRRTLVWLTERARQWLAEEQEPLDGQRTAAALAAMEPAERRQFVASFERFIAIAQRLRPKDVSPLPEQTTTHQPNKHQGRRT
jgi:DNA-binding MarR family transcriptional regulator